jgi:hypothetical protein
MCARAAQIVASPARVEPLRYATSVHLINGVVEMHAVLKSDPDEQRIARVIDGNGETEQYQGAFAGTDDRD